MKPLFHPETEGIVLESVFSALSDPVRLRIVTTLSARGKLACRFLDQSLAPSTLSHHCKVLREAGVIQAQVAGTERIVSLRKDDLESRFPGLLEVVLKAKTGGTLSEPQE